MNKQTDRQTNKSKIVTLDVRIRKNFSFHFPFFPFCNIDQFISSSIHFSKKGRYFSYLLRGSLGNLIHLENVKFEV